MEAYRVFSETICKELEEPMPPGPGAPPPPVAARTRFTTGKKANNGGNQRKMDTPGEKASGNHRNMDTPGKDGSGRQRNTDTHGGKATDNQRIVNSKGCGVVEVRPAAAAGGAAARARAEAERKHGDENGLGPNTFLTALKRSEGAPHPGLTKESGGLKGSETVQLGGLPKADGKLKGSEGAPQGLTREDGRTADDDTNHQEAGEEENGDSRDAIYDPHGKTSSSSHNNSSLVRQQNGKRKIDKILSAASREFVSAEADVDDAVARTGRGGRRGRRGRRPAVGCLDMQRSTLRSAR